MFLFHLAAWPATTTRDPGTPETTTVGTNSSEFPPLLIGLIIGVPLGVVTVFIGCGAMFGYMYVLKLLLSLRKGPELQFTVSVSAKKRHSSVEEI